MNKTAVVYVRLSQQGEQEESIDRQIMLCSDYCRAREWDILLYREPKGARSGYYEAKRPAWQQLKKDLAARSDIVAVVVTELSRASRNTVKTLEFIDLLVKRNILFVSLKEQIDPHSATGRAFLTVASAFNQWERDTTSERKKRQYAARDKTVYASNVSPYGLARSGHYPHITWTSTADFPVVVLVAELYLAGYGAPAIATELNRRGYKWISRRLERVPVSHCTVRTAIHAFERYQPFLEPALYDEFIKHRAAVSRPGSRHDTRKHPPALLTALLFCALCGARFYPILQKDFRSYRHRKAGCVLGDFSRRRDFYEQQVFEQLAARAGMSEAEKWEWANTHSRSHTESAIDHRLRRSKLMERLRGYEEMRADKEISRERFLEVKEEIDRALDALPPDLLPLQPAKTPKELYAFLDTACGALAQLLPRIESVDSRIANTFLRSLISRITVDAEGHVQIEYAGENTDPRDTTRKELTLDAYE